MARLSKKEKKEFANMLFDHLEEVSNGDEVIIRRAEDKWVIISMSGAYVTRGFGTRLDGAWSDGD